MYSEAVSFHSDAGLRRASVPPRSAHHDSTRHSNRSITNAQENTIKISDRNHPTMHSSSNPTGRTIEHACADHASAFAMAFPGRALSKVTNRSRRRTRGSCRFSFECGSTARERSLLAWAANVSRTFDAIGSGARDLGATNDRAQRDRHAREDHVYGHALDGSLCAHERGDVVLRARHGARNLAEPTMWCSQRGTRAMLRRG